MEGFGPLGDVGAVGIFVILLVRVLADFGKTVQNRRNQGDNKDTSRQCPLAPDINRYLEAQTRALDRIEDHSRCVKTAVTQLLERIPPRGRS